MKRIFAVTLLVFSIIGITSCGEIWGKDTILILIVQQKGRNIILKRYSMLFNLDGKLK